MITKSPVASWIPRLSAAPFPIFCGWRKTLIWGCEDCNSAKISRDPSPDPSSTHNSSISKGTASTRSTTACKVARSLNTGITTESFIWKVYDISLKTCSETKSLRSNGGLQKESIPRTTAVVKSCGRTCTSVGIGSAALTLAPAPLASGPL